MKRSEMLRIIKSCIKFSHEIAAYQYARGEISLGRFAELCSKTILDRIEKAGMLPPCKMYEDGKCNIGTDCHEWSNEE